MKLRGIARTGGKAQAHAGGRRHIDRHIADDLAQCATLDAVVHRHRIDGGCGIGGHQHDAGVADSGFGAQRGAAVGERGTTGQRVKARNLIGRSATALGRDDGRRGPAHYNAIGLPRTRVKICR